MERTYDRNPHLRGPLWAANCEGGDMPSKRNSRLLVIKREARKLAPSVFTLFVAVCRSSVALSPPQLVQCLPNRQSL